MNDITHEFLHHLRTSRPGIPTSIEAAMRTGSKRDESDQAGPKVGKYVSAKTAMN